MQENPQKLSWTWFQCAVAAAVFPGRLFSTIKKWLPFQEPLTCLQWTRQYSLPCETPASRASVTSSPCMCGSITASRQKIITNTGQPFNISIQAKPRQQKVCKNYPELLPLWRKKLMIQPVVILFSQLKAKCRQWFDQWCISYTSQLSQISVHVTFNSNHVLE